MVRLVESFSAFQCPVPVGGSCLGGTGGGLARRFGGGFYLGGIVQIRLRFSGISVLDCSRAASASILRQHAL